MFCKYCGNRLDDGDRFCGACGHPVDEKLVQEAAPEKVYKKQEDEAPKIRKRNPEPEYDNRMTAGMGYGYRVDEDSDSEDDDEDDYEEEWEREEKKEKITFAVLGVIIVVLVVAIVFGVVKLVGAGGGDTKKVSRLNEQMKEDMQKSQERDDNETAEAATVAPTQQATPEPTPEVVVQEQNEAAASDAGADTGSGDYVIPDSSTRYLTNADLNGLSEWQIRIARNEIYARHGRIFKSDDLADYFASKSWYTPSVSADQFDNSYLNSIEIENLKLITAYEKAHNLNQ